LNVDSKTNKIDGSEEPGLMLSSPPQSLDPAPSAATQKHELNGSEGITDEHRNGSITAIGIVLGFSLTFLSSWMHAPEPWDYIGIVILLTLASGIALQIISLRRLLILPQAPGLRHSLTDHNRAATLFFWGTALVSAGFFLWVLISMVHDLPENGQSPLQ
jgi:hypothetical protein